MSALANSYLDQHTWLPGVVVALALGVSSIGLNLYFRHRDRDSKTLDYRVLSDSPIVRNRPDDDALKVTYLDEEVQTPRILRIKFTNTGKQVIRATDFLDSYTIRCQGSYLLDTIITDESDQNLVTWFESDGADPKDGKLTLTCNTLNPGDTFTVQMILDSDRPIDVSISGRIEGQTRKTEVQRPKRLPVFSPRINYSFTAAIALFGLGTTIITRENPFPYWFGWFCLFFSLLQFAVSVVDYIVYRRIRKRNINPNHWYYY